MLNGEWRMGEFNDNFRSDQDAEAFILISIPTRLLLL